MTGSGQGTLSTRKSNNMSNHNEVRSHSVGVNKEYTLGQLLDEAMGETQVQVAPEIRKLTMIDPLQCSSYDEYVNKNGTEDTEKPDLIWDQTSRELRSLGNGKLKDDRGVIFQKGELYDRFSPKMRFRIYFHFKKNAR